MNIYALPKQLHTVTNTPRIIALGVFDGIHIGHRAVLSRTLLHPDLCPAVFTFRGMTGMKSGGALQTADEQRALLETLGFADLFEADFDAIRNLSPEDFVAFLQSDLHAQAVVCGYNFHFGKNGAGDTVLLAKICEQAGITLHIVPAVTVDGEAVSSTRIRNALAEGNVRLVTRLLAHPFTIHTPVNSGQQLGRELGTPTINQILPEGMAVPRYGVYASVAIVNNKALPAVTDVGIRPTLGGTVPTAETFILGFDGQLYGETVCVQLIEFLRDEKKFASIELLKEQITKDVATVTAMFTPHNTGRPRAILFDFDDTLQDRDAAMRCFVQFWLGRQFPDFSEAELTDATDRMIKAGQHGFSPYKVMLREAEKMFPERQFDDQEFLRLLAIVFPANTATLPDAAETLQKLRDKGYLVGVLTNGYSHIQNRKLDVSGLRPLLDYVMISGEDNMQKPEPEAFRRIALRLGVHPADCVYVGDNPVNDVQGAENVGMHAVFRDIGFAKADDRIPHIHNLIELTKMY